MAGSEEETLTLKLLKMIVGGIGVEHPIISTVIVMLVSGLIWYSLIWYYKDQQRVVQSPASSSSVPSLQPQVKTAVDSPCSNNSVTAGGTVSIECPPNDTHPKKGNHGQSKKP
jgi:hypothetical protein